MNGLGVSGSEVIIDGDNLVITVPGDESSEARNLGQTARLYIRPVIHVMPAAGEQQPPTEGPAGASPGAPPGAPGAPPGAPPGVPGMPPIAPLEPGAPVAPPGGAEQPPAAPTQAPAPQPRPYPSEPPAQPAPAPPPAPPGPNPPPGQEPPPAPGTPAPPPGAPGTSPPAGEAPRAQRIADEKELRQSSDQQIQILALQFQATRCGEDDVLAGNDDPNLPLITCSQDGKEVYLLDKSIISGEQIENANSGLDQQQGVYVVDLQFKGDATKIWADFTAANVGTQTAFVLDSEVVSAPEIREPIPGGRTQITGQFNETTRPRTGQRAEVRLAAAVLRVVGGRNRLGDTGFDIAAGRFDRGCGRPRVGAALLTALLPGAWRTDCTVAGRFRRNGLRDYWCSWADTSATRSTWRVSRV